ncbi:MAG TPA: GNAT family N-acetyltransferase [Allosphingosinicella sp.]
MRIALPLERRKLLPSLQPLSAGEDGYLITALRADLRESLEARHSDLRPFLRSSYQRHYASLQEDFDAYLARFSAKTRSSLKRKTRKLAERSGGKLDFRSYSRPDEIEEFQRHARAVSAKTYQERLLGCGLPDGEEALAGMRALAANGAMRGWLLFLDGAPISYLYAPAQGDTLIYAYLGYDPAHADLSPGTVLQLEAMRELMGERSFRTFDFTEGEGQHKRQFATGSVDCVDLLLLRPTLSNLVVGHVVTAFDAAIAGAKARLAAHGLTRLARAVRR